MLTQSLAVFLQTKFFSTKLTLERIVVVAALFADEKDGFFFLTFGHDRARRERFTKSFGVYCSNFARGNYCSQHPVSTSRNRENEQDGHRKPR